MLGAPLDYLFAFLVGGLVCLLAQLLIDLTKLTPARILVVYVVLGVFLGAVGLFEPLADFAGCGITVPLIGFGGNVARGGDLQIQADLRCVLPALRLLRLGVKHPLHAAGTHGI